MMRTPHILNIATCKSCGAPIIWAATDTGKRMPIDRLPAAGGNVRLTEVDGQPHAAVVGATIDLFDPADNGDRHLAHFVTCPDADDWRSK